ncbi:MAG: sulfide/dihydroorotate dehydrogenase-like FAD/NAD-binding protein, partial [Candidatus Omnitrophota bacterium]
MKILQKEILVDANGVRIIKFTIHAPSIAQKAQVGQFVVLMVSEVGERIPLTIVERDPTKGTIILIVQEIGFSTKLLGKLNPGDSLYALVGPLGHATEMKNFGNVIVVGGGVGVAVMYPVAKAFQDAGNTVTAIIGAKSKDLLILKNEVEAVSSTTHITTDDGTVGRKGFVTEVLKDLLSTAHYNVVYAVGPIPMMKFVSRITHEYGVKTIVSLNSLMIDGTGMCGGCRVSINATSKFTCVDGPEFDGHAVDWDMFEKRTNIYKSKESHICKLD